MESPPLTDSLAETRASFLSGLHALGQKFPGRMPESPKRAEQGQADQSGASTVTSTNNLASNVAEFRANNGLQDSHVTNDAFLKLITDVSKNNEETDWALEKSHTPTDNRPVASNQIAKVANPPNTPKFALAPVASDVPPPPAMSPGGRQKSDIALWERQICWANLGKAPYAPLYYFVQQLPLSGYGIDKETIFDADYKIIPKERKIGKYKTDWGTMEEGLVMCPPILYARKTIYFQCIKLEHPDNYLINNDAMKDTTKDVEAMCRILTCKYPQGWDFAKNEGPPRAKQKRKTKFFASNEEDNDEETGHEKDQIKWVYQIWASADVDGEISEVNLIVQQDNCLGKPAPTYASAVHHLQSHMWNWIQPMLQQKYRSAQTYRITSRLQNQPQQRPHPFPSLGNGYSQGTTLRTTSPSVLQPGFGVLASDPAQSAEIDKYFQRFDLRPPPMAPLKSQASTGVPQQWERQQTDASQNVTNDSNDSGGGNYRGPYHTQSQIAMRHEDSSPSVPATKATNLVPNVKASEVAGLPKSAGELSTPITTTARSCEQSSNGVSQPSNQGSMSPGAVAGSKRKIDQVEAGATIKANSSHVPKRLPTLAQSPHMHHSNLDMRSQNMIHPTRGNAHHDGVPSNRFPVPKPPHHNSSSDWQNSRLLSLKANNQESQRALANLKVGLAGLERELMDPQLSPASKADLEQKIQYALNGKKFHETRLAEIRSIQNAGWQAGLNSSQPEQQPGQTQPPTLGFHGAAGQAFVKSQGAGARPEVHGQQRRNSGVRPPMPPQAAQTNTARYQGNPPYMYQPQSLHNNNHGWPIENNGIAPSPQLPQGPNMMSGHPQTPGVPQRPSNSPPLMIQSPAAHPSTSHHSQQPMQSARQSVPSGSSQQFMQLQAPQLHANYYNQHQFESAHQRIPRNASQQMLQLTAEDLNVTHNSQQNFQGAHQRVPTNGQGGHQQRNVQHMNRGQMPQSGLGQPYHQNPLQQMASYQEPRNGQGSHRHQKVPQPVAHNYNPPRSGLTHQQYLRSLNQGHNANDGVRLVSVPGLERAPGVPRANSIPQAQVLPRQNGSQIRMPSPSEEKGTQNATINGSRAPQAQSPNFTPPTSHAHGQDTGRSDRAQIAGPFSLNNLPQNQAFSIAEKLIARQSIMQMVAETNKEPLEDVQRRVAATQNSSTLKQNPAERH